MKSEPGFARGVCLKLLWLAGVVVLLQGCATTQSPVQVFYATDRARVASFETGSTYGTGRGAMNYGTCYVDIPKDHRAGRMGSSLDADTDVALMKVWPQEATNFFSTLNARLKASHDKDAFIFIHGYNVTFDAAARRTAQMAYDLSFKGVPVFYSWPSRGNYLEYLVDEANIEWTQYDLQHFLNDFVNKTDTENIYLIAHSMGSRALTRALGEVLASNPAAKSKIRELILCAPDIDADVFKRDIAPQLVSTNLFVTLYASNRDRALALSKEFHGYPRLGEAGASLVVLPGIDTIDASAADTSLIGHSYFAEEPSVLSDIFYLMRDTTPLAQKPRAGLEAVTGPLGAYWEFKR